MPGSWVSGIETYFTPDGTKVDITHDPITKSFSYSKDVPTDKGALSKEHSARIGPFTKWEISIPEGGIEPKDANLDNLDSITIEFEGTYRGFKPAAIKAAEEARKKAEEARRAALKPNIPPAVPV